MNLGPLTTAFAPAPGCNDTVYGHIFSSGTIRDKFHSLGPLDPKNCYPASYTTRDDAYYSPGICPSAWSSACGTIDSIGSMTETRVTCCPNGYVCAATRDHPWYTYSCSRLYTSPPRITVPQTDGSGNTIYMETTLGGNINVFADAVQVRFQKADLETTTTTSSGSTLSSQTSAPSRPEESGALETGAHNETGIPPANNGGKGLGTAAYAGIGVGIAVALVAAIGVLIFLRQKKRQEAGVELRDGYQSNLGQYNSAAEMASATPVCEVGAKDPSEIQGDTRLPQEMDAKRYPQEMDAKGRVFELR